MTAGASSFSKLDALPDAQPTVSVALRKMVERNLQHNFRDNADAPLHNIWYGG